MNIFNNIKAPWHKNSWLIYFGIIILMLTTSVGMLVTARMGSKIGNKYTFTVDAVMEVKYGMASSQNVLHKALYYENLDKDISNYNKNNFYVMMEITERYIKSLLTGGINKEGLFPPLDDKMLLEKAKKVKKNFYNYKNIFIERDENNLSISESYNQNIVLIHKYFTSTIELLNEIEKSLYEKVDQEISLLKILQNVLVFLSIFVAVTVIFFLRNNNYRINRYVKQLFAFQKQLTNAKEEAEQAVKVKSQFLAQMGHEIRTPMNAIIGMSEILFDLNLDEKEKNYVRIINNAGSVLLALINDLLDLSKIELGHFQVEEISFNLEDVIQRVEEIMHTPANTKNLDLKVSFEILDRKNYVGDPSRISQILINLIGNAVKFTNHGHIELTVFIQNSVGNVDEIIFNVKDSGIGIAKDKIGKIFDEFVQGDNSTFRKYGGTGLGLAICKRLVELMNGKIWVNSKISKGSTFSFSLPLKVSTEECLAMKIKTYEEAVNIECKELRILLVDDSSDNRLIINTFLSKFPFEIDEASNGREAIDKFTNNIYDVVLMDMNMPVLDGFEATKIIRKWEKVNQQTPCPIIALTAHGLKQELDHTIESGCTSHLTKPIRKDTLLKHLDMILS